MISRDFLITLLAMSLITYGCRIGGFLLLRRRALSPRLKYMMNVAPACVLLAVIAPSFVSDKPWELLALALTVYSAWRWSMLVTVPLAVAAAALLERLFV